MNKKIFFIFGFALLLGVLFINFAHSAEIQNCCEKTISGAWCQNAPANQCDSNYKSVPTSCEQTSICQTGTCVNTQEGTCLPNVPQQVCNQDGGIWKTGKPETIPECQLGCCLVGDGASLSTLTRCKKLSSLSGVEVNYRSDITTEVECIANANPQEKGACVYEKDFQKTCLMTTKETCSGMDGAVFNGGTLCSATVLGTNCAPSQKTVCDADSGEVYFVDTCGNKANVYDASKVNDENYWSQIQDPSCDDGLGNKNSATCGACSYVSGSTCDAYDRSKDPTAPKFGNNICQSLDCTYDSNQNGRIDSNEYYTQGEQWCSSNAKKGLEGQYLPGERDAVLKCQNGEVIQEPCAEYRNEICVQDEVNGVSNAACVVNKWQDCINQSTQTSCESDVRDCNWISGISTVQKEDGSPFGIGNDGKPGTCVPKYSPGFNFWEDGSTAPQICSIATQSCVVKYSMNIVRNPDNVVGGSVSWKDKAAYCVENCYCIPGFNMGWMTKDNQRNKFLKTNPPFISYDQWSSVAGNICTAMGDCGTISTNYLGIEGEQRDDLITSEFVRKA